MVYDCVDLWKQIDRENKPQSTRMLGHTNYGNSEQIHGDDKAAKVKFILIVFAKTVRNQETVSNVHITICFQNSPKSIRSVKSLQSFYNKLSWTRKKIPFRPLSSKRATFWRFMSLQRIRIDFIFLLSNILLEFLG